MGTATLHPTLKVDSQTVPTQPTFHLFLSPQLIKPFISLLIHMFESFLKRKKEIIVFRMFDQKLFTGSGNYVKICGVWPS